MPTGVQPHNEPPSGELEQPDAETARLWPLLCARDPATVAQLYRDHFAALVCHLRKKLPSWVDPDDLAQEVFLRAMGRFHPGSKQPFKLRRWLYGIANHVLAAHYKKARPSRDVQGQTVVVDLPSLEAMTDAGVPVAAFGVAEPGFDSYDQRTAVADAADVVNSLSSPLLRKLMQTHLRLLMTTGEEVTGQPLAEQANCTPQEAYRWTNRGKDKIVHWMALLAVARSSAACPRAADIVPPLSATGSRPRRLRFTDLSREQLRDLDGHVLRDDDPQCPHCPEVYQAARKVSAHALGWGVLFTVGNHDQEARTAVVDMHTAARSADAAAATPASGSPALAGVSSFAEAVPARLSALVARGNHVLSEAWATMAARIPLLTNVASAAPGHAAVVRGAAGILGIVLVTAATVGAPEPGHRRPPAVVAAPPVGNQVFPVPTPPGGPAPTAAPGPTVGPSPATTGPGGAGGLAPEATGRPTLTPTTGPAKAAAFPCAGLALTSATGPASTSRPAAVSSGPSPSPAPAGAHPVTIDATALAYHGFIIPGVTPAFIDSRRRQQLQLTPGRYAFQFASGYYASFTFTVTGAGTVDYAVEHESFLSGRGTTALSLDGLTVTIDARQVSGAGVVLANMPMTTADWIDRRQLQLLPARHYTVQQSSGELADLSFTLGVDGRFSYDPSLGVDAGGVLSGRGSPTLQFIGHRVCLDARSAGGSGVGVHPVWGMPFSRTGLQYVALLPQRRLALKLEPGSDSPLRFAVAVNGTIGHDPSLTPYLHTSRIDGHQVLTATGRPG